MAVETRTSLQIRDPVIFYCRGNGGDASGTTVDDAFVVFAGSLASPSAESLWQTRDRLLGRGVIVKEAAGFRFTRDYVFNRPSPAAEFILGRRAAQDSWKTEHDEPLTQLRGEYAHGP